MKITEGLMTGTNLFKQPVYQASLTNSLRTLLCTKGSGRFTGTLAQFPEVRGAPWWTNHQLGDNVVISCDTPVRHKVYDSDELGFLIEYDNLGELSLDTLVYLADSHDRCTFEVDSTQFISLFKQLSRLTKEYKYNSNVYNVENDYRSLPQNYMIGISFYKMHTFLYDIYGNKPKGLGVAFEIFNANRSVQIPTVAIGYYLLLTDVYEGVFYVDGREMYAKRSTDFSDKAHYMKNMIDVANMAVKQTAAKPPFSTSKMLFSNVVEEMEVAQRKKSESALWDDFEVEEVTTYRNKPVPSAKYLGQYETYMKQVQHTAEALQGVKPKAAIKAKGMFKQDLKASMKNSYTQSIEALEDEYLNNMAVKLPEVNIFGAEIEFKRPKKTTGRTKVGNKKRGTELKVVYGDDFTDLLQEVSVESAGIVLPEEATEQTWPEVVEVSADWPEEPAVVEKNEKPLAEESMSVRGFATDISTTNSTSFSSSSYGFTGGYINNY